MTFKPETFSFFTEIQSNGERCTDERKTGPSARSWVEMSARGAALIKDWPKGAP